eukprot:scaffold30790_cov84-Amphora_coffeaeformis.AAC.1
MIYNDFLVSEKQVTVEMATCPHYLHRLSLDFMPHCLIPLGFVTRLGRVELSQQPCPSTRQQLQEKKGYHFIPQFQNKRRITAPCVLS